LNSPVGESWTSTLFGVGGAPATQLRLDASGRAALAGQIVRKLAAVPPTAVTFMATAVAVDGMTQLPFVPCTRCVNTPPAGSGVETLPTVSGAGRVSRSRHGAIGTNDDAVPPASPHTCTAPIIAVPTAAATAIATARFIPQLLACRRVRRTVGIDMGTSVLDTPEQGVRRRPFVATPSSGGSSRPMFLCVTGWATCTSRGGRSR
jgi:hypothetical protein